MTRTQIIAIPCARSMIDPSRRAIETVERKGLGHPDSIAEMLADEFIRRYALFCLAVFGAIPNANADKVIVVGGIADLNYGRVRNHEPPRAILIGKVTEFLEGNTIPIREIFHDSVVDILTRTVDMDFALTVRSEVINVARPTPDHEAEMYQPASRMDIRSSANLWRSMDSCVTEVCFAYTETERMIHGIEIALTSDEWRQRYPMAGTDVKVLGRRIGSACDITVAAPVRADRIRSEREYLQYLSAVQNLSEEVAQRTSLQAKILVNTKDRPGHSYLTAYGSALDKGDQGVVGRGNGPHRVRSTWRPVSTDALPGKNPFAHPGKIHHEVGLAILGKLSSTLPVHCAASISANNGDAISEPSAVVIQFDETSGVDPAMIANHVVNDLERNAANLETAAVNLALTDPVEHFRQPIRAHGHLVHESTERR